MIEAPDLLFAGEVMASGHLDWPIRSVLKKHVGLPDGAAEIGRTGSILQGHGCILFFFQVAFVSLEM